MIEPVMLSGGHQVAVVGESHYQENLDRVCGGRSKAGHAHGCVAILRPEPSNPSDPNAVAVYIDDLHVGYLSRDAAQAFLPVTHLLAGRSAQCSAIVRGGWDRGAGDTGNYGVTLNLAPFDDCLWAVEASRPQL